MSTNRPANGIFLGLRWNPLEVHHLYHGLITMGVGWWMMASTSYWIVFAGLLLFVLGAYVAADDIYQHWRQRDDWDYHSPVHVWYGKYLYGNKFVRWLNDKASAIMHKLQR